MSLYNLLKTNTYMYSYQCTCTVAHNNSIGHTSAIVWCNFSFTVLYSCTQCTLSSKGYENMHLPIVFVVAICGGVTNKLHAARWASYIFNISREGVGGHLLRARPKEFS